MPGPAVDDADQDPAAAAAAAHRTGCPPECLTRVVEHVGERALELRRVGAYQRQVGVERSSTCSRESRGLHRSVDDLLDRAPPRRGSAAPASRRERSSRLSTIRASRAPPRRSRRRAGAGRSAVRVSDWTASPAVTIAVSGERRSWETARSSAVFTSSLRRSAARLDRLGEHPVALERDRHQRLDRGRDALRSRRSSASAAGRGRPACRAASGRSAGRTRPSAVGVAARARRRRRHAERRRQPRAASSSEARESSEPSSSRASSAARSASRRRCSASRRARARDVRDRLASTATRGTPPAPPSLPSEIASARSAGGGRVERRGADAARWRARPGAPHGRDDQDARGGRRPRARRRARPSAAGRRARWSTPTTIAATATPRRRDGRRHREHGGITARRGMRPTLAAAHAQLDRVRRGASSIVRPLRGSRGDGRCSRSTITDHDAAGVELPARSPPRARAAPRPRLAAARRRRPRSRSTSCSLPGSRRRASGLPGASDVRPSAPAWKRPAPATPSDVQPALGERRRVTTRGRPRRPGRSADIPASHTLAAVVGIPVALGVLDVDRDAHAAEVRPPAPAGAHLEATLGAGPVAVEVR